MVGFATLQDENLLSLTKKDAAANQTVEKWWWKKGKIKQKARRKMVKLEQTWQLTIVLMSTH